MSSVTVIDGTKHVQLASGTVMSVPDSRACADIQSGVTVLVRIEMYPNGYWSPVEISKIEEESETTDA